MDNGLGGIGGEIFSDAADSVEMVVRGFPDIGDVGAKDMEGSSVTLRFVATAEGRI